MLGILFTFIQTGLCIKGSIKNAKIESKKYSNALKNHKDHYIDYQGISRSTSTKHKVYVDAYSRQLIDLETNQVLRDYKKEELDRRKKWAIENNHTTYMLDSDYRDFHTKDQIKGIRYYDLITEQIVVVRRLNDIKYLMDMEGRLIRPIDLVYVINDVLKEQGKPYRKDEYYDNIIEKNNNERFSWSEEKKKYKDFYLNIYHDRDCDTMDFKKYRYNKLY